MSGEAEGVVYVYMDGAQEGTVDPDSLGQVLQLAASQHRTAGKIIDDYCSMYLNFYVMAMLTQRFHVHYLMSKGTISIAFVFACRQE